MKPRRKGGIVDKAEMRERRKLAAKNKKKKKKISKMPRKTYIRIVADKKLGRLLQLHGVNTSSIHNRDQLKSVIISNLGLKAVIKVVAEAKWHRRSILSGYPTEPTRRREETTPKQLQNMVKAENRCVFQRNWLDLPHDVLSLIFTKLGVLETLLTAQMVCSQWHHLSKQPHLFQSLEIPNTWPEYFRYKGFCTYAKKLIERSCGQMVRFACSNTLVADKVLPYLASHCKSLKCLVLDPNDNNILAKAAKEFTQLEHLHLHCSNYHLNITVLKEIGISCQKLKRLRVDFNGRLGIFEGPDETFVIARYMPHLQHLHITASTITNEVLLAIIAGCPLLKYVLLRGCDNIKLELSLTDTSMGRIRQVRLQKNEDEYDQYEFDLATCGVRLAMSESKYQELEKLYDYCKKRSEIWSESESEGE